MNRIEEEKDLPDLHRFVVELKTTLPENISYEQSPLLLDGLRVHEVAGISAYTIRLRAMLEDLSEKYFKKAGVKRGQEPA